MTLTELERAREGFEADLKLIGNPETMRRQLLRLSKEYLQIRVEWGLAGDSARTLMDESRTRSHDAFLTSLNAVTRQAVALGSRLEWRRAFGVSGASEERKALGDFACYLAFNFALESR
jgi:hypothetical protein